MKRLEIAVPNHNDSFSRVTLDGKQFMIRFTWNDTAQRWCFGLYTMQREPLAVGLRMVPRFPLNIQIVDDRIPSGIFGVYSDQKSVGRKDFIEGKARFTYISANQEGA